MYEQNQLKQPLNSASLTKRALVGALIGLAFIGLFLSGVNNPNPAWPRLWMLRPLIIVPLAGAMGGVCYYVIDSWSRQRGISRALVYVASLLVYLIGLWLGVVLGLDGTLWD